MVNKEAYYLSNLQLSIYEEFNPTFSRSKIDIPMQGDAIKIKIHLTLPRESFFLMHRAQKKIFQSWSDRAPFARSRLHFLVLLFSLHLQKHGRLGHKGAPG